MTGPVEKSARLSRFVDVFAIRFHIELLQMGGKPRQRLRIGNDQRRVGRWRKLRFQMPRRAERSGRFFLPGRPCMEIHRVRPAENFFKPMEPEAKAKRHGPHHRGGRVAPSDKIPDIKRGEIARWIVHRAFFTGDGDEMFFRIKAHLLDAGPYELFIRQGLQGRSRFRDDHNDRLFEVDPAQDAVRIVGIDVRDEVDAMARPGKWLHGDRERSWP